MSVPAQRPPAAVPDGRRPLPPAGGGDLVAAGQVCTPTPRDYRPEIAGAALEEALAGRPAEAALALKVRLPFCRQACRVCTSRRVPSRDSRQAEPYLSRLDREMVLARRRLAGLPAVTRLHWGGGAPAFLALDQMSDLFDRLDARFGLSGTRERDFSIELDPREADMLTLRHLQALGFNRLTLGVTELDPRVQQAINRVQPRALTEALVDEADRLGFRELTLTVMLGLPFQTPTGLADTLEQLIAMAPARIRLARYDHHPERHPDQRAIHRDWLPNAASRGRLVAEARQRLAAAGYVHVGLGLHARPDDRLARALADASLGHGPLGFSAGPAGDLLGLGVGATTRLGDLWVRNAEALGDYEAALDAGRLPTAAGCHLDDAGRRRRALLEGLLGGTGITLAETSAAGLLALLAEGLVERLGETLRLTEAGRWRLPRVLEGLGALPDA
ncbi:radical SAM protein [Halomonas sp.]|uniref:radical SAM protein n=1 Tax=Halomonas sp. TaxID=1486246 RepID=UPI002635635B|nr:radical SAM protein [Halomonas sp.]